MIQQKEIFKKIGAIIVEINEQYQYLAENPEQLNDLELELFSANADFLSEHVKILRRINKGGSSSNKNISASPVSKAEEAQPISETIKKATPVENVFKEPVQQPEIVKPEIQQPKDLFSVNEIKTPEPPEEVITEETESSEEISPVVEKSSVPEIEEDVQKETEPSVNAVEEPVIKEVIIPEKVATIHETPESSTASSPAPTLNDIISAQKAQTIQTSSQFNSQVITDLKTSISLNDKLLFIKDLFNGYSLAYSEAIEILNRFDNFDVAETFLKTNYAAKNNWAAKQDTVEKFYEVLHRRYSK